ncbi:MAG: DegT/DnrJ/EryC1/StrS family aminotransferase [Asticcacaulis sp.]
MQPRLKLDIGWIALLRALLFPGTAHSDDPYVVNGLTCVPGLSVRTLWDAILAEQRERLPQAPEVVMSGVNIEAMAALVEAHGLDRISVDLDLTTLKPFSSDWNAVCGPRTAIALVAHLYGTRNPVSGLKPHTLSDRSLLVEDCAQAFSGHLTISEGADVALYSFGPIKRWTALGGAIAVFRDLELAEAIYQRIRIYPRRSHRAFQTRVLKYLALKVMSHPSVYGALVAGMMALGRDPESQIAALARGFTGQDPSVYRFRMSRPQAQFLKWRLRQSPLMANYAYSARSLALRPELSTLFPGWGAAENAAWLFPVMSQNPERLIHALRSCGFDATRGATSLRALSSKIKGQDENAPPNVTRLLQGVVYLPSPLPEQGKAAFNRLVHIVTEHEKKGAREG